MHSPGGAAHNSQPQLEDHYRNNGSGLGLNKKYHDAVLARMVEVIKTCA